MSLATGSYHIITADGSHAIGRNFVEDMSLLPKRVMTLPMHRGNVPRWEIKDVGDGKYKIKTGGSYVGILPDGHVCAFLLEDMLQGAEWKIEAVPQHGESAYIIHSADGEGRGWTAQSEDHQQLTVNPLICTPSLPPHYMPNQVFKITHA